MDEIAKSSKCSDIYFDEKTKIPEVEGKILIIEGENLEPKTDALHSIFRQIQSVEQRDQSRRSEIILDIKLFVPQGLVSMVIGRNGR